MTGITQADMNILSSYAQSGNRLAYWNYLANLPGNDNYGRLALSVVRNDNMPGAVANHFAAIYADLIGVHLDSRRWDRFGREFLRNHKVMSLLRKLVTLIIMLLCLQGCSPYISNEHLNPNNIFDRFVAKNTRWIERSMAHEMTDILLEKYKLGSMAEIFIHDMTKMGVICIYGGIYEKYNMVCKYQNEFRVYASINLIPTIVDRMPVYWEIYANIENYALSKFDVSVLLGGNMSNISR